MPSDLTGTPTSLGIGTYNTSQDAPSGLGFNEAIAQIDALIAARPKTTTSPLAGGPPVSPNDGDIWIATGVDGSDTARWQFQYNAGSSSAYKWEFLGGADVSILHSPEVLTTAINTWMPASTALTIARPGDYRIRLWAHFTIDTTFTADVFTGVRWSGALDFYMDAVTVRTAGDEVQVAYDLGVQPLHVAGTTLTPMGQATAMSAANYPRYRNLAVVVTPVRVA